MEVASLSSFRYDPDKVLRLVPFVGGDDLDCEPNAAHIALASLEKAGLLEGNRDAECGWIAPASRLYERQRTPRSSCARQFVSIVSSVTTAEPLFESFMLTGIPP